MDILVISKKINKFYWNDQLATVYAGLINLIFRLIYALISSIVPFSITSLTSGPKRSLSRAEFSLWFPSNSLWMLAFINSLLLSRSSSLKNLYLSPNSIPLVLLSSYSQTQSLLLLEVIRLKFLFCNFCFFLRTTLLNYSKLFFVCSSAKHKDSE